MEPSFRLGRIAGVDVGVHWTVMLIVAIVASSLGAGVLPDSAPGYRAPEYWTAGLLAAVGFGASILAHELSHAIVARRRGVAVDSIVLWLFGGVAKLRSHAQTADCELRIAIAGPAISVAIGVTSIALALAVDAAGVAALVTATLTWFGATNLLLAVFNMLPGAPLDGGRVLTAILWHRSGDEHRARALASSAGRVLGQILIALGIVQFAFVGAAGLWTALVGWLIVSMARMELAQNELELLLAGVKVGDVMTSEVVVVPDHLTVAEFMGGSWPHARVSTFPLVSGRRPSGLLTFRAVAGLDQGQWTTTRLASIALPLDDVVVARPDDSLKEVLAARADDRTRVLVVVDDVLVGIVSPTDVARAIERLSAGPRAAGATRARSALRRDLPTPNDRRHGTTLPPPPTADHR